MDDAPEDAPEPRYRGAPRLLIQPMVTNRTHGYGVPTGAVWV